MFLFPAMLAATTVIGVGIGGGAPVNGANLNGWNLGNANNQIVIQDQEGLNSLNRFCDTLKGQGIIIGSNGLLSICPPGTLPDSNQPILPDFNQPILPDNNQPILPDNQPDTELPDADQPGQEDGTENSVTAEVVRLVNEERTKAGVAPLTAEPKAGAAAAVRAKELETSFSHTRPNGSGFESALKEQGASYTSAGENIAWGQKSAQEVVTAWMNSAGHRANILSPNFTQIGVGHYQSASGTQYWTQLFTN